MGDNGAKRFGLSEHVVISGATSPLQPTTTMTRKEFTHSYNGQDTWVFQMDPAVGAKGLSYRVRHEKGTQWTECVLRRAPKDASTEALQQFVIDWEGRILRPHGSNASVA